MDLVHLIGIILIVRNWVIELVNKLLIISIILLHLKLSHWICLILHLLIHILNHSLVPHHQVLHYHWIALLWCVLMNWKRRSVSHLAHFICLLRNRRKKFCLLCSHTHTQWAFRNNTGVREFLFFTFKVLFQAKYVGQSTSQFKLGAAVW